MCLLEACLLSFYLLKPDSQFKCFHLTLVYRVDEGAVCHRENTANKFGSVTHTPEDFSTFRYVLIAVSWPRGLNAKCAVSKLQFNCFSAFLHQCPKMEKKSCCLSQTRGKTREKHRENIYPEHHPPTSWIEESRKLCLAENVF